MWLAGGGVKRGYVHGATDEFGFKAVENKVHVHDLHATMLHLMGFDHEKLTYRHAGRDFRLTDVHGRVVRETVCCSTISRVLCLQPFLIRRFGAHSFKRVLPPRHQVAPVWIHICPTSGGRPKYVHERLAALGLDHRV